MRWRRFSVLLVVILLSLPVLLGGTALALLQMPAAQRWVTGRLAAMLEVTGLSVAWPLSLHADRLRLVDREGAWLSANDVFLDVSPGGLWRRTLHIRRLSADTAVVIRSPQSAAGGLAGPPRLPVKIVVDRLSVARLSVDRRLLGQAAEASLSAAMTLDGSRLAFSLGLAGRLAEDPSSFGLAALGAADLAGGCIDLGRLRITRNADRLLVGGRIEGWGRGLGLLFSAELDDAGRLLPDFAGRLRVTGAIGGTLDKPRLSASATATPGQSAIGTLLGLGLGLGPGLGPAPRLSLDLALSRRTGVALLQLRLVGRGATFTAGGRLGSRMLAGARMQLADLGPISGGRVLGAAEATALAVGQASDPLVGVGGAARVQWRNLPWAIQLRAVAGKLGDQPTGEANLEVSGAGRSGWARTAFRWGEVVRLDDLAVHSGDSLITGHLGWRRGTSQLEGRLHGNVPDLADWQAMAGIELGGSLGFDLSLTPVGRSVLAADLTLAHAVLGRLRLDSLRANATGALDDLVVGLSGDGFQARGRVRPGSYRLSSLSLDLGKATARLTLPAELTGGGGGWRLSDLSLALDGGRISMAGRFNDGVISGRIDIVSVALAPLSAILPGWQPAGLLSGRLVFAGTPAMPRANGMLKAVDLDFGNHRSGIDVTATVDWDGRRVSGHALARGFKGSVFSLDGGAPLEMVDGHPQVTGGALSVHLDGHGDLGRIAELLPLGDQSVSGAVMADLSLGGTTDAPTLAGRLELTDGGYRNFDSGTVLTDITLTATVGDIHRISVAGHGKDTGEGRVSLAGTVDPLQGEADLTARLDRLAVARLDLFKGDATGDLGFSRGGGQSALSGSLTLDSGEVDIGQLAPASIVPLKVVEENVPPAEIAPPVPKGPAVPVDLALDLDVADTQVRGKGLDSRWKGRLHLAGPLGAGGAAAPAITGRLVLVRGSYTLFGVPLQLSAGTVAFDGEQPVDPRIDATATGQTSGATVEVRLTGTLKKPDFAFTSDPPMPKDEVLAHLLFGNAAGQLSVLQQITLARAAATRLTGEGAGFDPLDKLRGFLGLDMLQAGGDLSTPLGAPGMPDLASVAGGQQALAASMAASSKTSGASLSLGKYIGSRTYLRVDQGTTGGRVTVEEDLGHGFAVDSRLGEGTGGGIGFSWKRDY